MYALVMWIGDEPTTSVVLWNDVEVIGKKTRAKWGPKYWPVQVLRQSADKAWLESLSVIANGQVIWGRREEQDVNAPKKQKTIGDENAEVAGKKSGPSSPRRSSTTDEKSSVARPVESDVDDESEKKNDSDRENDSDASTEKIDYEKNDSDEKDVSDARIEKNDSDKTADSDETEDSDEKSYSETDDSEESDSSNSDDSASSAVSVVHEAANSWSSMKQCNLCPKITEEIVAFLEHYVKHLKTNFAGQQKKSVPITKTIHPKGKSELVPGSGVWISNVDLIDIKKAWKKPKDMVRRLMRSILDNDTLRHMSPTGKGSHQPIPKNIYLAVESFVNDNTSPDLQLTRTEYTRCLTLMCNTLRNPKLSPVETPKRRKSSTSRKNKSRLDSNRRDDERRKRREALRRMIRGSKRKNGSGRESPKKIRLAKRLPPGIAPDGRPISKSPRKIRLAKRLPDGVAPSGRPIGKFS